MYVLSPLSLVKGVEFQLQVVIVNGTVVAGEDFLHSEDVYKETNGYLFPIP
jgi:hypothetical protein